MKKLALVYMLSLVAMSGCAENSTLTRKDTAAGRTNVFEEMAKGTQLQQGAAGLDITAVLKTHEARPSYIPDLHGTSDFSLQVIIDGQAEVLSGTLRKEQGGSRDLVDPEAGTGVRYRFNRLLRLKGGKHKIVVALPDDGVSVAREVVLDEGRVHTLVVEPVYHAKPGKPRPGISSTATFKEGVRTFRLFLDGKRIEG